MGSGLFGSRSQTENKEILPLEFKNGDCLLNSVHMAAECVRDSTIKPLATANRVSQSIPHCWDEYERHLEVISSRRFQGQHEEIYTRIVTFRVFGNWVVFWVPTPDIEYIFGNYPNSVKEFNS